MVDRLMTTDPLAPINYTARFVIDVMSGKPERCEEDTLRCLAASPEVSILRSAYAMSLIYRQRDDEAKVLLEAAPEETVPTISGRLCTFLKHALAGRRAEAPYGTGVSQP